MLQPGRQAAADDLAVQMTRTQTSKEYAADMHKKEKNRTWLGSSNPPREQGI
jgi:hypothetical protein